MNTFPVFRRGRRYFRPGPKYNAYNTHRSRRHGGFCSWLLTFIIILMPFFLFLRMEGRRLKAIQSFDEIMRRRIIEMPARVSIGDIVHGSTEEISSAVTDMGLHVTVDNALTMERNTEYCQWRQMRSEKCETCSRTVRDRDGKSKVEKYKCDCITQYNYFKTWTSHLVNSFFFDQPAAHHNPSRDPVPSTSFVSTNAKLKFASQSTSSEAIVSPELLRGNVKGYSPRVVKWIRSDEQPPPSFFHQWFPDKSRYENIANLKHYLLWDSRSNEEFAYVGDGYFFSPYEPSKLESMFKMMGEYLEGSLFDWQLGDIFPSCTPGDIRISYSVQDPMSVSILAQVEETLPNGDFVLAPIQTNNGQSVAMIYSGLLGPHEMITREDSESRNVAIFFRALCLLWTIGMLYRFAYVADFDMKSVSHFDFFLMVLSLWGIVSSLIWTLVWGQSRNSTLLMAIAAILLVTFLQKLPVVDTKEQYRKNLNPQEGNYEGSGEKSKNI